MKMDRVSAIKLILEQRGGIAHVEQTEEYCMLAVKIRGDAIMYIDNPSYEVKRQAILTYAKSIRHMKDVPDDLYDLALSKDPDTIEYIPNPSDEQVISAVSRAGYTIAYVKQNEELCRLALANDPNALMDIELQYITYDILREYLPKCPDFITRLTGSNFQMSQELYELAIENALHLFSTVPEEFINYEMCLRYLECRYPFLSNIPEKFYCDHLFDEAAKNGALHLDHLTDERIMSALKVNPQWISKIPNPSDDMKELAVSVNSNCLTYVEQTEELCWLALKNDISAIYAIEKPTPDMLAYSLKDRNISIKYLQRNPYKKALLDEMMIDHNINPLDCINDSEESSWTVIKNDVKEIQYIHEPTIDMYRYVLQRDPLLLSRFDLEPSHLYETDYEGYLEICKCSLVDPSYMRMLSYQPEELCLWLVEQHPLALEYIYNQTDEVIDRAVKLDPRAKEFIIVPSIKAKYDI